MNNDIMNARVTKSLMYPEQGSPDFFERHKIMASRAIEDAIINNQYECVIIDSDLYIGGDYGEDKIITYLKWLGYSVESYSEDGLGIKISWGY